MYDKTNDIFVKNAFKVEVGEEDSGFVGDIYKYNDGEPKLQISRYGVNKQGKSWVGKFGRLTFEELKVLLPHMQEALVTLEKCK